MDGENYTAYPFEEEFLLMDGCRVLVLDVEFDVRIVNKHANMARYNGQLVTVIYLFH